MDDQIEKKAIGDHDAKVETRSFDNGAVEQFQSSFEFSPIAEKRLVQKIDRTILPIMVVAYMMAFLDKQTLSYSALMGLLQDLHLTGTQYSWASGIFYFGYLFFSYPASLLMVKFPLGKYLAVNFILWAIVLACHAATTNFATLMVARFFLGCTEASLSPGFTLITSLWYRTSEQPLRAGIWFCGNSLSLVIGNSIAVGILEIKSKLGAWQWLFIIFGVLTFVWGVLMLFRLPNSPTDAPFLTEEERMIATERLRANHTGFKNTHIDKGQIMEVFQDPKTLLLAIMVLTANIPNGGYTTFNGLVLKGFGFDTRHTLLLALPGGFIVFLFVLSGIVGSVLVYVCKSVGARYAGLILMGVYSTAMPIALTMISSNVGGFTKKATVGAVFFIFYFFENEAPKYQSGFLAIIICLSINVVDSGALMYYLRWENTQRDKRGSVSAPDSSPEKQLGTSSGELSDITDLKNDKFRYVY
ncbi:hypothetical protein N7509_012333 [Penicillium cosmopolitanum]|uniref:Major facilitator superfamily (MFS) profile domain-containing protein n=1 Tax=Penicillium cosmopolitanum TaxID=1131564 RepID=A0A9W9SK50_9EURO|nr:uncharacterized protein N7509_012333 [Penicillium cosmopolitanum]KAJ5379214.1 hypothetical protein N7509_012333 [Penicillium cosmopolitanum]